MIRALQGLALLALLLIVLSLYLMRGKRDRNR